MISLTTFRRGDESPTYDRYKPLWADDRSQSRSRSTSPARETNIEFIDEIEVGAEIAPLSSGIDIEEPMEGAPVVKPLKKYVTIAS